VIAVVAIRNCRECAIQKGKEMIRKMKRGAGVVAFVVALLAVTAAPASASFHSETAHTVWSGTQVAEDVVTFNAGTWKCKEKSFSGTTSAATSSTLNLTPSVSECTAFGFVNAAHDINGCEFQYHDTKTMSLVCPEGKSLVITAFNCWITLSPQSGLTGVTYTNVGSGKSRDITISQSTSGIKYTQTSKSFPGCTNGTFSNGTIAGEYTLRGFNTESSQVGVWASESGEEHKLKTETEEKHAKEHEEKTNAQFHAEAAHSLFTGAQVGEDSYTFTSGSWKCTTRTYAGTSTVATNSSLDLTPTFSGCSGSTTVDLNGCVYRYQTKEKESGILNLSIVCPAGKAIVITSSTCDVTIPAQSGLSATYAEEGSGKTRDVKITHSITGLKYSQQSTAFPGCTAGEFTNGTYSGSTTLKATNTSGEQIALWLDDPGDEFKLEDAHTLFTAAQIGEDSYVFTGGTWKCSTRSYAGTSTTVSSTTISLTPSFSGCTESPTIDINGCEYRYHTGKEGVSTQGMSIVCPAGKAIVITSSTCHVTIPAQSGLIGVTYTNEGSGKTRDVKITHSITGLKYSQVKKNFPGCTEGEFTNGTYSGSTTLKGTNTSSEQIGVWVK
jgi:hypothetical protein